MKISPHYDAIKSRALTLLSAGSINNHSMAEIAGWRRDDLYVAHNSVGVALCIARDEIESDLRAEIMRGLDDGGNQMQGLRDFRKLECSFTKGNFRKAEAEIIRELCPAVRGDQHGANP